MIWSVRAGLALALALVAACTSPAGSVPTRSSTTQAPPVQPVASSARAAGASTPTQAERSVMVGDRAVTLLPYVWRDFQPGDPAPGVYFSGTVRSADGSVPAGMTIVRFWVVMDAEVWTDVPREVRVWTHRETGVASVEAYASDGPAWAPENLVRAIVRVSYRGKTFDLDAEPAAIQSAS